MLDFTLMKHQAQFHRVSFGIGTTMIPSIKNQNQTFFQKFFRDLTKYLKTKKGTSRGLNIIDKR